MARPAASIDPLTAEGIGSYPDWKELVFSFLDDAHADIARMLRMSPQQRVAAVATAAGSRDEARVAAAEEQMRVLDRRARAKVVQFLDTDLGRMMRGHEGATDVLEALRRKHAQHLDGQKPAWLQQLETLQPAEGERVGAYCDRADELAHNLALVGMRKGAEELLTKLFDGLRAARPEWAPHVIACRREYMTAASQLGERAGNIVDACGLRGHLVKLEMAPAEALAPETIAPLAAAAAALTVSTPAQELAALKVRNAALEAEIAELRGARRPRSSTSVCHRCGKPGHIAKNCPAPAPMSTPPPAGVPPANHGAAPPSVSALRWLLDSGASHHMSSGGMRGAAAFSNYRPLPEPVRVNFGKRGSSAPAVGIGDLVVCGSTGTEVLRGVLHVPELAASLFSVRAALASGLSVQFSPPTPPATEDSVVVLRHGRVVLTASAREGLFFVDSQPCSAAAAAVSAGELRAAVDWHRRLGHLGFSTLADLARSGLIEGCPLTPAAFLQAREQLVCEPCNTGKLRRVSHPRRAPRAVTVLHRIHADLCEIAPGRYVATAIDEATRFARVSVLPSKAAAAADLREHIAWFETQTGARVQRLRHDRGGEYMSASQQQWCAEKGIQLEATAGHTPEANGLAERHNLVLLDMMRPMLADSGDTRYGLAPLTVRFAADAAIYANDLHNATPSSGAVIGRTPHAGLLQRAVTLGAFQRFGSRVYVHSPGHLSKLAPRGVPGRFLGFARPFGSNIVRVLLDDGRVTQSQTVVFDHGPSVLPPVLLPRAGELRRPGAAGGGERADSDDGSTAPAAPTAPPAAGPPAAPPAAAEPPAEAAPLADEPLAAEGEPPAAAEPPAGEAHQPPARPPRSTRNPNPWHKGAIRVQAPAALAAAACGEGHRSRASLKRGARRLRAAAAHCEASARRRGGASETPAPRSGEQHAEQPQQTSKQRMREFRGRRNGARKQRARERAQRIAAGRTPPAAARVPPMAQESTPAATPTPKSTPWGQGVPGGGTWAGSVREDMQRLAQACAAEAAPSRVPRTAGEALRGPDAAKWRAAMDAEIASCEAYGVWEACELPAGRRALPSHFVLDEKRDGRGKARLVAGGHKQQPGVDFGETFAPVASYRTLRMMLAVAAHEDLELRQFDVRTAFLNAPLDSEVYLRPPSGFEHLAGGPGRVLRLHRALYGLRQASRAWNKQLERELTARGFVQSDADPSLWLLRDAAGTVLTMFYVDDGMVAARTAAAADALVALVASMFSIRVIGEPEDMLGVEISRDRAARTLSICQARKALQLAADFGVEGERRATPMTPAAYGELRAARDGDELADKERFQSGVGSLQHLAQCTRPDIAVTVGALASFSSAPTAAHYDAMLDVVRYVGATATRGITYGLSATPCEFWCDANFAACEDTRRSTTGVAAVCFGGAVSWESRKQKTTAASTMEAEYQACGAAAREALSLRKLFGDFEALCGELQIEGPLRVRCDNQAALVICQDRKETQRVKHIDIVHHFARDRVASGEIVFEYCRSESNVSDCLTKALPRPLFEAGLAGLGMLLL